MKKATRDWTDKGEGDWQVAKRESQAPDPVWDAVCFHAQQCAEKYLKGLLEEYEIAFTKTHDLVVLLGLIDKAVTELHPLEAELAYLSPLAVATRYPGTTADETAAAEAIEIASNVRRIIRATLDLQ